MGKKRNAEYNIPYKEQWKGQADVAENRVCLFHTPRVLAKIIKEKGIFQCSHDYSVYSFIWLLLIS
jgi:hypothetical protein